MVKDTYTFENGYKVKMSLTPNPYVFKYQFYNSEDDLIRTIESSLPTHQSSNRTSLISQIKNCIDGNVPQKELDKLLPKLDRIILALQGEADEEYSREQRNKDFEIRKKAHKAKKFMETLEQPLLYIGSISDWLTAGERINTLICFCAGCSQIILKEPISMIGYGEASSGKTFVQRTALSLLPDEFVEFEKQVSPAALFNRAKKDKYYYDGKIVVYGDMGGQNDRDNMQEALDLMKELQTDGFLKKPVSVKGEDGKWEVEDLELEGRPAVWYTTVPVKIDKQEESRAILFSPRTDNRDIFNKRGSLVSLKMGKTYNKLKEIEKEACIIKDMVLHLREVMKDYIVINPYFHLIADILENSRYYKRDTDKYLALLNAITVINFYHNEKITFDDGQKAVITSKNDVQLLLSLLEPYMLSISENIKPKSREIYEDLRANIDDWKTYKGADDEGYNSGGFLVGITINDFFEKSDVDVSLSSLYTYFSDLRDAGLLTIVGKEGKSNQYDIVDNDFNTAIHDVDFSGIVENIREELGSEIADIVENDVLDKDLNIMNKHDSVEDTKW